MKRYSRVLKKALENKVLRYVFSRYATYIIQFLNSLFIAVYLGPYYLGIWGFITLVIQYLNQINLGIAHSVNAIIAINKSKEWYVQKIIGNSLSMLIGLSMIVIIFFGANELFNLNLGSKYCFSTYTPVVAFIGILGYFNTLFSSIFRVYGKVNEIAINQSAFPVLMLATIMLFKGENLLWALVIANLSAFLFSFFLYSYKSPVKLKPILIGRLVKVIQIKGWHLFVYNSSFYLIIISTRSFISAYYTVEEFGYFTFAFTLANVALLLLQSFSFLIYPKLLNRIANATNDKIVELLGTVRDTYIVTSHLLIHLAILLIPLFMFFFPQYNQTENAFKLIALSIVLHTNSFGYTGVLVAKNFEKKLGYLSFIALLINITIAIILIKVINVRFEFVFLSTMFTYFIYVLLIGRMGLKILKLDATILDVVYEIFPLRLLAPFVLSLCLVIFSTDDIYFSFPFILYCLLNAKHLSKIKRVVINTIENPKITDI